MAVPVLNFPRRQMPRPPVLFDEAGSDAGIGHVPTWQLWRSSPANAFGAPEQAELTELLGRVRPLRVEHWDAALAGDAAAAVALALRMSGVEVLDTARHDLVMSMVLVHALAGSAAARTVLAFTLDRRRYLGENVDPLVRSWRGPSRTEIRRAAVQALMEALS
ncbi:hypothetical protein SAMN05428997_1342 [Bosea sp. CRIB-10]|uniref:hypothetical protein n=1 Tax=Bosea sp. CRIB-10 TaxID=378404 RepID=UPI0008E4495D|nr:hypothetical protein [Bosea sp. CRIB-10]SFD58648.1 hypothetical protein SAMN05428997_1342 [Bosea sp. CRIB-10]